MTERTYVQANGKSHRKTVDEYQASHADEPHDEDDISGLLGVQGVMSSIQATPMPEPIERRLQRAWLNGFKEGVERSAFAATEATGRWDY
jgi:hypothetical protein